MEKLSPLKRLATVVDWSLSPHKPSILSFSSATYHADENVDGNVSRCTIRNLNLNSNDEYMPLIIQSFLDTLKLSLD